MSCKSVGHVQCQLFWEHILLGHNTKKSFVVQKVKVQVIRLTRRFKKFCSVCKNLDDHARSGKPKTVSKAMLQEIKANPRNSTSLSGGRGFLTFMTRPKASRVAKYQKTFLTHPSILIRFNKRIVLTNIRSWIL